MAYSFPVPLNTFFETFRIQSVQFDLKEAFETDETGSGEILSADVGARLWEMQVNFKLADYREGEALKAKLNVLRYAERSLIIHAIPSMYPTNDPNGTILGASVVTLDAVALNNREITLGGLPPGFRLEPGDCLSFQHAGAVQKFMFHQVANTRAASGAGVITQLEVTPFVEPGWPVGGAVQLIKPRMKAVLVPGSFNPGSTGQLVTSGITATFRQTMGR